MQVQAPNASDGYTKIPLPETLSDAAIRDRSSTQSRADSESTDNAWPVGTSDLLLRTDVQEGNDTTIFNPPDPRVIKALPHRGTRMAPGGPAWSAGDRRLLGGFDARFHSTSACVPAAT